MATERTGDGTEALRISRIDLAAALRWAWRLGFGEGICNHFSTLVPDGSGRFLINPFGRHWAEMRAGDPLLLDRSGRIVEGDGTVETTALRIHSALRQRRPDIVAVMHTHMPWATALTMVEGGRLEPAHQNALRFGDAIAYDDEFNGLALDEEEGRRISDALGDAQVLFLANHGVLVTGASVAEAFDRLYYVERAARTQVLALSTGRPLRLIPEPAARRTRAQFIAEEPAAAEAHFAALKRLLTAESPDFLILG